MHIPLPTAILVLGITESGNRPLGTFTGNEPLTPSPRDHPRPKRPPVPRPTKYHLLQKDTKMKQKNINNVTGYYALVQWTYWLGNAAIGAFASAFLLEVGLSNTVIGLLLAVGGFTAAILPPFLGSLIDRNPKISTMHVLTYFGIGLIAIGALLLCFPLSSTPLMAALYALGYIFLQTLQPFINGLGVECINEGFTINFGFSRASGAFGYCISALLMGILSERIGIKTIPAAAIVTYAGMILSVAFLKRKRHTLAENGAKLTEKKGANLNPIRFLKRYPTYAGMLVGMVLIYFSHGFLNTFCLQILQSKGGDVENMGIATSVAAAAEIIPMLCAPFLLKHFRLGNLLRFSGVFYTIKSFLSLLAPNVFLYYGVQMLQLPAWGIMATTIVFYVNETVEHEHSAQGQAFAGMTLTVGCFLCSLIGGWLIDLVGIDRTILVATVVCLIGAVILFLTTGKQKKPDNPA